MRIWSIARGSGSSDHAAVAAIFFPNLTNIIFYGVLLHLLYLLRTVTRKRNKNNYYEGNDSAYICRNAPSKHFLETNFLEEAILLKLDQDHFLSILHELN